MMYARAGCNLTPDERIADPGEHEIHPGYVHAQTVNEVLNLPDDAALYDVDGDRLWSPQLMQGPAGIGNTIVVHYGIPNDDERKYSIMESGLNYLLIPSVSDSDVESAIESIKEAMHD